MHWRSIRKTLEMQHNIKSVWFTYAKPLMAMQKEGLSLQVYRGEEEEQQWVRFLGSATKLPGPRSTTSLSIVSASFRQKRIFAPILKNSRNPQIHEELMPACNFSMWRF